MSESVLSDLTPPTPSRPTVLVVDDVADNLNLVSKLLKDHYRVKLANNGERALQIVASDSPPDLILLDVMMPQPDGYEVCRRLKQLPARRDIPVIFLTAKGDMEDEYTGLALGAVDYLSKPVSPPILLARVKTHLELAEQRVRLAEENARLESQVEARTRQIALVQDVALQAMANLGRMRQAESPAHLRRIRHWVRLLAEEARSQPRFAAQIDDAFVDALYRTAALHDIGKIGIPDRILLKLGQLSPAEEAIYRQHPQLGFDALQEAESQLDASLPILTLAKQITLSYQERWDGSGYPQGLSGDDIPLAARILALAVAYDRLTPAATSHSRRPISRRWTRSSRSVATPSIRIWWMPSMRARRVSSASRASFRTRHSSASAGNMVSNVPAAPGGTRLAPLSDTTGQGRSAPCPAGETTVAAHRAAPRPTARRTPGSDAPTTRPVPAPAG